VCKKICAIREHFARVSHSAPCCNNPLQVAVYFKRSSDEFARASLQYVTGEHEQQQQPAAEAAAATAAVHTAARQTTHVWRQHMSHITHAFASSPGNTSANTTLSSAYAISYQAETFFGAQSVLESSLLTLIIAAFVVVGGRCAPQPQLTPFKPRLSHI